MNTPSYYYTKPPFSIEAQIQQLKNKNVLIYNDDYAKSVLSRVSYYRISGYLLPFKIASGDYGGVNFSTITSLLSFDQSIRSLVLKYIEHVEVSLRTFIINAFNSLPNANGFEYRSPNYFLDYSAHASFLLDVSSGLKDSNELYAKHFLKNYRGDMPIWVAVELLSFGKLSRLYSNLSRQLKTHIAQNYNSLNIELLEVYLRNITTLRNRCAHFSRLYYRRADIGINKKWYSKRNLSSSNSGLFTLFLIMKELCVDTNIWKEIFFPELETIILKYSEFVNLDHIYFPENWADVLS